MNKDSFVMEISEKNLIENISYLENKYNKKILPVIKANAYGHGVKLIAETLYKNGYQEFCVARLSEAKKVLAGKKWDNCKILVFESLNSEDYEYIINCTSIDVTANTFNELKKMIKYGIPPKRIQIKIDFGFGRNGIEISEILELKKYIYENKFKFRGIYSHLYASEIGEGKELLNKFSEIVTFLDKTSFEMIHMQNSTGILFYGTLDIMTHLRSGIFVYGLQEEGFFHEGLKQVFLLKGKVAGIRDVENSKYLAYTLKADLHNENYKSIAKIKIGYGDGFLKCNEGSYCLIKGKPFKILSITMDNSFIVVDESVSDRDEVILYPDIDLVRENTGMHICEVLPLISERIERVLK